MMEGLQPYPEYKESVHPWIDKIPAHWEEKRAKHLFREVDDRSKTGDEELLSVSHITGVTPRSQKNINMFLAESYIGSKLCHEGDLVINTMWAWMAALGVSKQTGIVSPSYGVYRPKSREYFINEFIDHLLRTQFYADEYLCRSTGIRTSRLRLYPEYFLQIPIINPPLEEQGLIVKYLRWKNYQIGQYIRGKRREIDLLNEQKQAIIHQVVTRGLNPSVPMKPSGIEWLGDIPEHWILLKIKRFTIINPSKSESFLYRDRNQEIVFLPMEKIGINGEIDCSERRSAQEVWNGFTYFKEGDVILAKITPCFENGKSAYLSSLPSPIGFGTTELFVFRVKKLIHPKYLYYLFQWHKFKVLGIDSMVGAAGQKRVSSDFIRNFATPIPSYNEQCNIISYMEMLSNNVNKMVDNLNKSINLIQKYRTRLITDVVTGKLDIRSIAATLPDVEDIPLDILIEEEMEEEFIDGEE